MIKLGVNVDHIATLREVRGTTYPSPLEGARLAAKAGAHGVTLHLREDRRHIQDADVYEIHQDRALPLNLEMGNHPDMVKIALDIVPDEVCLVPESREELTTESGLDVVGQFNKLKPSIEVLLAKGIVVSPFIDPSIEQLDACVQLKVSMCEFHTGTYCELEGEERAKELERLIAAAEYAHAKGITVNAGHGINLANISELLAVPHLHCLNIGHSLVARAVFVGFEEACREMLRAMNPS